MAQTLVHRSESITVWYDDDVGMVHHEMHGFCAGAPFRAALTAGTDAMVAYGATKWLSDDRANGAVSPDDEKWAKTIWVPRTVKAGWKHWAMVLPRSVVGQMNANRFVKHYAELGMQVRIFVEPTEARAWLMTMGGGTARGRMPSAPEHATGNASAIPPSAMRKGTSGL